jgi:hypothetical protein
LCLTLLEEAALDGIPAIAIDPKGDLGNLLLAFPNLQPQDFRPWVDASEATRNQLSPDGFAAAQAELWRNGLAKWDQSPERIRRFCDAADRVIFTPGSSAGIPITVLKSFHAPAAELADDADAFGERVAAATSGLLALLGIDADPVRSREYIFLANVFDAAWRARQDLDLHQLIQQIQRPSFTKIGVIDLESFYPAAERYKLAMSLNNLLASPSFASWLQGEPLDIQRLLYSPEGKPRLAIVSIAHLDDPQRMFFVTILLNELLSWIRTQPGTSSLRAILYMDEVFGYFPPLSNPPAKRPMLTLLKQARAYGLGCVLATQNPVDLDYKGLSNAGTWFLGRLQTERDKARVIEGLEGASAQAGATFNRQQMEATLAALGKRVFLMNNVHEDAPVVFHTRWAMSYLCGPLTRTQIKLLMDPLRGRFASQPTAGDAPADAAIRPNEPGAAAVPRRPVLPASIAEQFAVIQQRVPDGFRVEYRPAVQGAGKVHFVQAAGQIDQWRSCFQLQTLTATAADDIWDGATELTAPVDGDREPDRQAKFAELPAELSREKSYQVFRRQLAEHLYRTVSLQLWRCEHVDQVSRSSETEVEFRARLVPTLAQRRSVERQRLEQQFAARLNDLESRIQIAQSRVSTQKWQFWSRITGFVWVVVEAGLRFKGMGRRGRPRSAEVAMRSVASERGQQATAQAALDKLLAERQSLEQQRDQELARIEARFDPQRVSLDRIDLKPRKADIEVDSVSLVWLPWRIDPQGHGEPVYAVSKNDAADQPSSEREVTPPVAATSRA